MFGQHYLLVKLQEQNGEGNLHQWNIFQDKYDGELMMIRKNP